jgi:chromate reductase, NAD(P)H dehydrogenase (quinone)
MRVLAISGSLRRDSHNTELLRAAAELLPPPVELEIFDGLKAVEPYDEDDDRGAGPDGARRLREAISSADALLIAAPEYNSSIPGQLKNAIDWASRPGYESVFVGKPCFVATTSGGVLGGVRAQGQIKYVLSGMLANVYPMREVIVPNANKKVEDGVFADETTLAFAEELLRKFIDTF